VGAELCSGPADRGGQPSSACKFVLVGLANHAAPDGTGAFPSVATLVRYTGLSERTVRTCLDRLEAAAIISACHPEIVAARIKRADRRPQGWDLSLSLVREDLDEVDAAVLEHRLPGGSEAVDNRSSEVHQLHPAPGTGCNEGAGEVQLIQPRGAVVAPEPSMRPRPGKIPTTSVRLRTSSLRRS
jgi:Helix-turn-helix domain